MMHRSQEGAALMVVMLLVLMTTATATFAIRSTTAEIGSASGGKLFGQTQHVAEGLQSYLLAYIDNIGPDTLLDMISASGRPDLGPFGPNLADGKTGYLFVPDDWAGQDVIPADTFGPSSGYGPNFAVEVTDHQVFTRPIAGDRADGRGTLSFLQATLTARARSQVRNPSDGSVSNDWVTQGNSSADPAAISDTMTRSDGAVDARTYVVFGPFQR